MSTEKHQKRRVSLSIEVASEEPVTIRVPESPGYPLPEDDISAKARYYSAFDELGSAINACIAKLAFASERLHLETEYDSDWAWQYVRLVCSGSTEWEVRFGWDGHVERRDDIYITGTGAKPLWTADNWERGAHLLMLDLVCEAEDDLNCAVQRLEDLKGRTVIGA